MVSRRTTVLSTISAAEPAEATRALASSGARIELSSLTGRAAAAAAPPF